MTNSNNVVFDATVPEDRIAGSVLTFADHNVRHLDPQAAAFQAMLEGWSQQQGSRYLKEGTIGPRLRLVQRLAEFSNQYPWEWGPGEVEAFFANLRAGDPPLAVSTARGYQNALALFVDYVRDPRYGWPERCLREFGSVPEAVLHEGNKIAHVTDYEGDPRRRPLTYDEVQRLFDAADSIVGEIRARKRKGALAAHRDALLLKTVYAFGLRRREAWGIDLGDLRHNPKAPQFGDLGGLYVRWGKSSRGSPPKRRTVLMVPEMDWLVDLLREWIEDVRPLFGAGDHPAMWVTERSGRMSTRSINLAFETARAAAGLAPELDLHCLRHSYVTHLVEFDYPERFVQDQVGHLYASTTAIYTGISDEYRNRLLARALERFSDRWENL